VKLSPGSGDCEVAAERAQLANRSVQFDAEMAAPVTRRRTPTGTGADSSTIECEWKQGESARGRKNLSLEKEDGRTLWRLPLVGEEALKVLRPRNHLTGAALSWKERSVRC
jgi:hypothetical protein